MANATPTSLSVPTLPLTVADLVCTDDVDPMAAETTSDLQTLTQDVYHLLIETRGSNPDDPERGIGVEQLLSGTVDDANKVPRLIEQQLGEDERIDAVSASLVQQSDGSYLLALRITVDGSVLGLAYDYNGSAGLTPVGG